MKTFLRNNINFFVYFGFSIVLELTTLFLITHHLFISSPWFLLTITGLIFSIYNLLKKRTIKNIFLTVCLCLQAIICLFCVILYENTGTIFDFSMLNLASETAKFMGTVEINYVYIIFLSLLILTHYFSTSYLNKFQDKYYRCNLSIITSSICLVCFLVTHFAIIINYNKISKNKFMDMLYVDSNDRYIQMGETGNFVNELYKMSFFNKYNELSINEIDDYIYSSISNPSEYFGVSKDNNLVTILVESLEWFAFISNTAAYPNESNVNEEKLDTLFPNLRKFYNMSLVANNHYSQNKTDISEDEGLLGIYPSNDYINYGFPNNNLLTSIANSIKLTDSNEVTTNFFHNNDGSFYNRINIAKNLGYDNLYFIEDMVKYGVTNRMNINNLVTGNEMNLDSEMIDKMKDKMFPTDKRFVTHITTISMHGSYEYRESTKRWHDKFNSLNINITNYNLKNYLIAVMEFDNALGILLNDLENKNLMDNTTIVLFSDHNTYMSDLVYNVKNIGIDEYSNKNYTELFRVPLMIYDKNIGHKIIDKFTTTYDIVPTVLDLFGIKYFSNIYYGNPLFSRNESVLYSRAFGVFLTDKVFFSNINNILYKKAGVDDNYIKSIEDNCISLVEKIYYVNHMFYYDYFKDNIVTYKNNFNLINQQ